MRTQSIREQSHEVKSFGGRRKERTLRDPLSKIATRRPRVSDTPHVDGRTFWSHRFRLRGKKRGEGGGSEKVAKNVDGGEASVDRRENRRRGSADALDEHEKQKNKKMGGGEKILFGRLEGARS